MTRDRMDRTDQGFEDNGEDLRARQGNAPVVDGVVHAVETQIDAMVVEDQTDENDRRKGDRRFQHETERGVLVIDTIEGHFVLDDHEEDAQQTEKCHQIANASTRNAPKSRVKKPFVLSSLTDECVIPFV